LPVQLVTVGKVRHETDRAVDIAKAVSPVLAIIRVVKIDPADQWVLVCVIHSLVGTTIRIGLDDGVGVILGQTAGHRV
jgi:hypothetical protein